MFGERQDAIQCYFVLGVEFIDGFAKNVVVKWPLLLNLLSFVSCVCIPLSDEVLSEHVGKALPRLVHNRYCIVFLANDYEVFG